MLLNTEIKITVTNNGKENTVSTHLDLKSKLSEILTSIKMAENALVTAFGKHIEKHYGSITEEEYEKIFQTLKMEDLDG